jgi:hypothetical protein
MKQSFSFQLLYPNFIIHVLDTQRGSLWASYGADFVQQLQIGYP